MSKSIKEPAMKRLFDGVVDAVEAECKKQNKPLVDILLPDSVIDLDQFAGPE